MGNYLETLKNISKDKNKERIIYIIILCIVLLIAVPVIFKDKSENVNNNDTSKNTSLDNSKNLSTNENTAEIKLAKILSEISGISDVSVMITYSTDTKINPVYNVSEEEKDGNKSLQKEVVYNEEGSDKKVVVEVVEMPKALGVIVVAKGASSVDIRSKIASAVSSVTNIGTYKVQVFEKGE